MKMFGWIEKFINERGSASIMEKRLALKDDEIAQLKAKIKDLEAAQQKEKIEADEIRIHRGIEFRRGKLMRDKWASFCPKCHLPAEDAWRGTQKLVLCSGRCGWQVFMRLKVDEIVQELDKP